MTHALIEASRHEPVRSWLAGNLVATCLFALTISACSKTGEESPSAKDTTAASAAGDVARVTACSLVTKAEVEAALGGPVGEPQPQESSGKSLCSYAGTSGAMTVMVEYPRSTSARTSSEFAAELAADVKKNSAADPEFAKTFGNVRVEPLEGLSVPAAWYDHRAGAREIWVDAVKSSGGTGYYLRVSSAIKPSLDAAKALAEKAAARLP